MSLSLKEAIRSVCVCVGIKSNEDVLLTLVMNCVPFTLILLSGGSINVEDFPTYFKTLPKMIDESQTHVH